MALPDFLIVGAMKCGTSTLQAQLATQSGIFMTTPKEPNFFSDDAVYALGQGWYEALFDAALPDDLKGEASTHYTKLPTYPDCLPRLKAVLNAPKLIYLIRNPVERAVSHYIHEWSMGVMSGNIETAFLEHPELISYGCYAEQIEPYVEAFGTGNIFLTSLEDMMRQPQVTLDQVGQFLGCDHPLLWKHGQAKVNVSAERVRRIPLHGLLVDNPIATALRRTLVPKALRDRIRNARQMTARPALTPDLRRHLEGVFARDYTHLKTLFPHADHLTASYPFLTS